MAASNTKKQGAKPETTGETVTVALKHPTGIILEVFEQTKQPVPDGVGRLRDETIWRSTGKQYPLNGNRLPFGKLPTFPIVGGYALTKGIPKEIWETWAEQHKDSDLVKNELIGARPTMQEAADWARERGSTKSGMEPLVEGDARADKRIAKAKEQPKLVQEQDPDNQEPSVE